MSEASAWAPFRNRAFRGLWLAGAVVNLAIWMQTVGAAWIMTTLTASPTMVSLVQSAVTLPVFLFALPGGVIADLVDRRHWLIVTQWLMVFAAIMLSVLAWCDRLEAWGLLAFTFVLGTGSALGMSAWMVTMVTVLSRDQVPAAVALNGIAVNVTRALGPALAGALIAYWNTTSVFLLIALCMAAVMLFLFRLTPAPPAQDLPPETLMGGMRSGLRYIRHSAVLSSALKQVLIFTSSASALWALMPLVARRQLGMGADGYGLLMAFLGAGAVLAALNSSRLQRRLGLRRLIVCGTVAFAAAALAAALSSNRYVVCSMMLCAGFGWMAVNATLSSVVQTYAANWVRARVASMYVLTLMGAMAFGGAAWGVLAEFAGLQASLLLSTLSLLGGVLLTRKGRVEMGHEADFAQVSLSDSLQLPAPVEHADGPVSVEVMYQVPVTQRDAFLMAVYAVGKARRRNGARNWRLYRDMAQPQCYSERFIVDSWLDYLRQQVRVTQADLVQERLLQPFRHEDLQTRRLIYQPPVKH
ncbi:MFS transporter [Pseudomonas sp. 148P]|uniref:MFS transporter n=1 Tax=Pseudomonas ulcerans TaxID=3115852 RepID=A0ABU7HX34_9PSED|nr:MULTISPECIES: MFS transporter [unclassified Pseudomonas]MEE1924572.1 MFS transporter [Pseudomonas sp. 147P]MEE1935986.1 MFS transporter [Pseudomonas sp. 148P]